MNNNFGLKKTDLENIISILQKESNVEKALIFGSRAKGNDKYGSDVDIALVGVKLDRNIVTHISFILNEETFMPYNFDVLNYNTINNKELLSHIDRAGKLIYSKS
ncbi:MAG TPA: nucleotidyltransferase domain-containing protein [Ignavibacteria bacterium]|nr:nucleotidyltransferase domain-containing protein [Ignavibacteria bacterium]